MKIQSSFRFRNLRAWFALVALAVLAAAGCDHTSETDLTTGNQSTQLEPQAPVPNVSGFQYRFESGMILQANGEPIAVESPGYACPTIADVDGDGVDDLVVGQFNGGKMHFHKNLSKSDEIPKYASQQWIMTGPEPAQVPGVS